MATVTSVGLVPVGNRRSWIGSMRLDLPAHLPADLPADLPAPGIFFALFAGCTDADVRGRAGSDAGSWDRPTRATRPSAGCLPRRGIGRGKLGSAHPGYETERGTPPAAWDRTREVGIGPPGLRDRARDASRGVGSDAGSWDRPTRATRPSAGCLPLHGIGPRGGARPRRRGSGPAPRRHR